MTMLLTYFASFTSYEAEIVEVFSNHIQESKFYRKIYKFGKNKKNIEHRGVHSLFFSKPGLVGSSTFSTTLIFSAGSIGRLGRRRSWGRGSEGGA